MNKYMKIPKLAVIEGEVTKIPLQYKGNVVAYALVDTQFSYIDKYYWHMSWNGYALGKVDGKMTRMHRLVMNVDDGIYIDHISMDKLDNRLSNLRPATSSENKWNKGKQVNNTSGYKGVYRSREGHWFAKVVKARVQYHAGTFDTPIEAAEAYNVKALELFGEFTRPNMITNKGEQ